MLGRCYELSLKYIYFVRLYNYPMFDNWKVYRLFLLFRWEGKLGYILELQSGALLRVTLLAATDKRTYCGGGAYRLPRSRGRGSPPDLHLSHNVQTRSPSPFSIDLEPPLAITVHRQSAEIILSTFRDCVKLHDSTMGITVYRLPP